MAVVTNYFPDPKLQGTTGTALLMQNDFANPSPVSSLTGWSGIGANYCLNPGFETNTTYWSAGGLSTITRLTTNPNRRSGTAGLQVENNFGFTRSLNYGCNDSLTPNGGQLAVTPGQAVAASLWVKGTTGSGALELRIRYSTDGGFTFNTDGAHSTPVTTTTGWQQLTVSDTVPAGATLATFVVQQNSVSNPFVYVCDDATLTSGGAASLTIDTSKKIKGNGAVTVVSPHATAGVAITHSYTNDAQNFAVYVRAHSAMTITGSITANKVLKNFLGPGGWGDYGWGETFSYVEGAAHTFAAGEVKRFRISGDCQPGGAGGGDYVYGDTVTWSLNLKGSGTFDVDAVWIGGYVDDGVDTGAYPAGNDQIANCPLYFDGNTADTADFSYEWAGTPNASASRQLGHTPKHLRTYAPSYELEAFNTYTTTLPGGEKAVAIQSPWDLVDVNNARFYTADGSEMIRDFITDADPENPTDYVLSFDVVSLYESYFEGYIGGLWDNVYAEAGGSYYSIPFSDPLRRRFYLPLPNIPIDDPYSAVIGSYMNWCTGAIAITSVALTKVDWKGQNLSTGAEAADIDLLDYGMAPGGTYKGIFQSGNLDAPGKFYRIEYQTGGGGSWTALVDQSYDAAYVSEVRDDDITVPAGATALRLVSSTNLYFTFYAFTAPVPYFDGDTPDGDGYTYAWTGTPHDSPSTRTEAAGIEAKVFVGGTAIPITEMRVVKDGTLVNVTAVRG